MLAVFSVLGGASILYGFYRLGLWIYEEKFLEPEERWRRRYDRKLKSYFKSLGR